MVIELLLGAALLWAVGFALFSGLLAWGILTGRIE